MGEIPVAAAGTLQLFQSCCDGVKTSRIPLPRLWKILPEPAKLVAVRGELGLNPGVPSGPPSQDMPAEEQTAFGTTFLSKEAAETPGQHEHWENPTGEVGEPRAGSGGLWGSPLTAAWGWKLQPSGKAGQQGKNGTEVLERPWDLPPAASLSW